MRESSDSDHSRTVRRLPVKAGRSPLKEKRDQASGHPPLKEKHDQASGSTDYTDTSYTVTESDMSFEADAQRKRNRGKQGDGIIEKTIEELSEEGEFNSACTVWWSYTSRTLNQNLK